jgi:hypothetical protein
MKNNFGVNRERERERESKNALAGFYTIFDYSTKASFLAMFFVYLTLKNFMSKKLFSSSLILLLVMLFVAEFLSFPVRSLADNRIDQNSAPSLNVDGTSKFNRVHLCKSVFFRNKKLTKFPRNSAIQKILKRCLLNPDGE